MSTERAFAPLDADLEEDTDLPPPAPGLRAPIADHSFDPPTLPGIVAPHRILPLSDRPLDPAAVAAVGDLTTRIETLAREATNQVARAGLAGTPVLASSHQRDFCEWLGLQVVGTFRAADTASVREIEEAIAAGKLASVKLVIANLPEGRRTADALAERLGARVVVFENFPALVDGHVSYDQMLGANVRALTQPAAR